MRGSSDEPPATPTPEPTGTPTPTPTPSPVPTEMPTPIGTPGPGTNRLWGDDDVDSVDALKLLRYVAALPVSQTDPCPDIGTEVLVAEP